MSERRLISHKFIFLGFLERDREMEIVYYKEIKMEMIIGTLCEYFTVRQ
jgi:hypothetical protein